MICFLGSNLAAKCFRMITGTKSICNVATKCRVKLNQGNFFLDSSIRYRQGYQCMNRENPTMIDVTVMKLERELNIQVL